MTSIVDLLSNSWTMLLTAMLTAIAGFLTTYLYSRVAEKSSVEKIKIEEVLQATERKTEEVKARLAEAVIEKLPAEASRDEVIQALYSRLNIAGDIVINQVARESSDFIQELVSGYHHQALSQARVQFWFSIVAATVGFAYILVASASASFYQWQIIVKILPGVIIDAVAALFFRQAEQTRQRATELYDRLRTDNQMSMARKLLDNIEDKRVKAVAQAQIALHMAGLQLKDVDVARILGEAAGNSK